MRIAQSALLALALAAVAGCSGTSRAALTVRGEAPLNLNEMGESTPVKVRIYQLRDDARFRAATVESLWTGDKDVLKEDLVGERNELVVLPMGKDDQPIRLDLTLEPATAYVGVLGLYSRSDAKDNRAIVIPRAKADGAGLVLTRYAVTLAP